MRYHFALPLAREGESHHRAGVSPMAPRRSTTCQCYQRRRNFTLHPMDMSDMATLRVRNSSGARKGNPGHRAVPGDSSSLASGEQ